MKKLHSAVKIGKLKTTKYVVKFDILKTEQVAAMVQRLVQKSVWEIDSKYKRPVDG